MAPPLTWKQESRHYENKEEITSYASEIPSVSQLPLPHLRHTETEPGALLQRVYYVPEQLHYSLSHL